MIQDQRLQLDIEGGKELASKIVELVQNRDDKFGTAISGMAIAYATLCVAEGVKLHDCMELVLTIYKHTKKIDKGGSDVELS
jgi:hypothetical protein